MQTYVIKGFEGREHLMAVLREIEERAKYQGPTSGIGIYLKNLTEKMGYELSMAANHWIGFSHKYSCEIAYEGEMEISSKFRITITALSGLRNGLRLDFIGLGIEQ